MFLHKVANDQSRRKFHRPKALFRYESEKERSIWQFWKSVMRIYLVRTDFSSKLSLINDTLMQNVSDDRGKLQKELSEIT